MHHSVPLNKVAVLLAHLLCCGVQTSEGGYHTLVGSVELLQVVGGGGNSQTSSAHMTHLTCDTVGSWCSREILEVKRPKIAEKQEIENSVEPTALLQYR